MLKELYDYRELLVTNVKKEIRGKYKASFLGVLWSFINPLLQVLMYAIVFPYLLRNTGDNYLIYLITGIIPWTYFANVITGCVSCIKDNSGIVKKVYFPRIILPISISISGMINFFISCIIVVVACLIAGVGLSWHLLLIPFVAIVQCILSLGIGLVLGACDAYVHDLEHITTFLLQMLMYGTPIIYSLDMFSNSTSILVKLIQLNPLTTIVNSYRDIFLYHQLNNLPNFFFVVILSFVILGVGVAIFKKLEKGFAEQF